MAHYVDGFVVPVPKRNIDAYRRMARKASKIWRDHGALEVRECVADDVKKGKVTSFPQSVKLKPNETVVFSWIEWPTKQARDAGHKRMEDDPRMKMTADMPFDGKRMIFGGFENLLEVRR
jgi:uncharacterized protein YbaA (DUF1428 family)